MQYFELHYFLESQNQTNHFLFKQLFTAISLNISSITSLGEKLLKYTEQIPVLVLNDYENVILVTTKLIIMSHFKLH